jgi:hypothetical protein
MRSIVIVAISSTAGFSDTRRAPCHDVPGREAPD